MIQVAHFNNFCSKIEVSVFTVVVHRCRINICRSMMTTFFDFKENRYNITKFQEMRQQKVRTVRYDLKTAL